MQLNRSARNDDQGYDYHHIPFRATRAKRQLIGIRAICVLIRSGSAIRTKGMAVIDIGGGS